MPRNNAITSCSPWCFWSLPSPGSVCGILPMYFKWKWLCEVSVWSPKGKLKRLFTPYPRQTDKNRNLLTRTHGKLFSPTTSGCKSNHFQPLQPFIMKLKDEDEDEEDARHSCAYCCVPSSVLSVSVKQSILFLKKTKEKRRALPSLRNERMWGMGRCSSYPSRKEVRPESKPR